MTEVLTLPNGLSAEEVEKLVTVPTEYGMSGMLHLTAMESISLYGLSDIRLYFDWDSDYEFDRVQTINQLQFVTLPQGIAPGLSPENPIGEIYRYTVQGADHDLIKEKQVEDWICEKQFKTVPGVLDVDGFGGLTKEYHVELDPQKLIHYAIPLSQVIAAIQNSNTNSGGNYLNVGEQAFDVRGIGLIHTLDDIRNIVLATNNSTPIRIANVGDVGVGWTPRLGIVGMNYQDEVVEGIVLMRKGGNTLETLKRVEAKAHELNTTGMLPKGYKVVPYYDRTQLVHTTLHTVAGKSLTGYGPGLRGSDLLSWQSAHRPHCRDQYSARDVWRLHSALSDRYARESAFSWRGRFRHHHRFHRHRDGEHLSPSHYRRVTQ